MVNCKHKDTSCRAIKSCKIPSSLYSHPLTERTKQIFLKLESKNVDSRILGKVRESISLFSSTFRFNCSFCLRGNRWEQWKMSLDLRSSLILSVLFARISDETNGSMQSFRDSSEEWIPLISLLPLSKNYLTRKYWTVSELDSHKFTKKNLLTHFKEESQRLFFPKWNNFIPRIELKESSDAFFQLVELIERMNDHKKDRLKCPLDGRTSTRKFYSFPSNSSVLGRCRLN